MENINSNTTSAYFITQPPNVAHQSRVSTSTYSVTAASNWVIFAPSSCRRLMTPNVIPELINVLPEGVSIEMPEQLDLDTLVCPCPKTVAILPQKWKLWPSHGRLS
jgi:hypothetical protein